MSNFGDSVLNYIYTEHRTNRQSPRTCFFVLFFCLLLSSGINLCTGVNCPRGYQCVIVDDSNFQCKGEQQFTLMKRLCDNLVAMFVLCGPFSS